VEYLVDLIDGLGGAVLKPDLRPELCRSITHALIL
jgi:hypothetical protein